MKDKFIKENEIYLIRKPKHSFLAVLNVDISFPLYEKIHLAVETMKNEGFDIFFIFNPQENELVENINVSKFTALEEGVGFIISTKGTAQQFIDVGIYMSETVKDYVGITFAHLSSVVGLGDKEEIIKQAISRYISLATSNATLPTLEITRRTPHQLFYIYGDKKTTTTSEDSQVPRFKRWITSKTEENKEEEVEMLGANSWNTHQSPTLFPFFRTTWMKEFKDRIQEEEDWWETWNNNINPLELISSGIKFFDIPWLDRSPESLDINSPSIKPEKKTVGRKKKEKDGEGK